MFTSNQFSLWFSLSKHPWLKSHLLFDFTVFWIVLNGVISLCDWVQLTVDGVLNTVNIVILPVSLFVTHWLCILLPMALSKWTALLFAPLYDLHNSPLQRFKHEFCRSLNLFNKNTYWFYIFCPQKSRLFCVKLTKSDCIVWMVNIRCMNFVTSWNQLCVLHLNLFLLFCKSFFLSVTVF